MREGLVLLGIILLGLSLMLFSPPAQYPQKISFPQAMGMNILIFGYPLYWLIRLIILFVIWQNKAFRKKMEK